MIREFELEPYCDEYEYEMFLVNLDDEVDRLAKTGYNWHIEGRNMGWLHRSGYKDLVAGDGQALMRGMLPDTDVSIKVQVYEDRLEATVYHHDAPTGEFYTITPKEEEEE